MLKPELARRLDKLTSVLVRVSEDRCATCGKRLPFKKRQAGHYIPRIVQRTRWDYKNVHTQCNRCNVELGGNLPKYHSYITSRYGAVVKKELNDAYDAYKCGTSTPMTIDEMDELYKLRLEKVRTLERSLGKELIDKTWN